MRRLKQIFLVLVYFLISSAHCLAAEEAPTQAPPEQTPISVFQGVQSFGIIVAILFTLYQFYRSRRETRQTKYLELHRRYSEFIKQSINDDDSPTSYDPSLVQHFISAGGTKKELLLYDLLFTTWESAFLLYQRKDKSKWRGWDEWIRDYFRLNIRCSLAWDIAGKYFDRQYVEYITNEVARDESPRAHRTFPNNPDAWSTLPVSLNQAGLKIGTFQVMQYWEQPLMLAMAEAVARPSGAVLEIGFGLGLLSNFIQARNVESHTIVESHPAIYSNLLSWGKDKTNVRPVLSTWECWTNTIPDSHFDSIFFDTYPLRRSLMHKNHFPFFSEAQRLLKEGGLFTYYSDEANHVCPEHQEMLLRHFKEFSVQQVLVEPPVDCEYWQTKNILLIVAKKSTLTRPQVNLADEPKAQPDTSAPRRPTC